MTQEEVACAGGPHSPVPGIDKLAIPHLSLAFMAAPIVPFSYYDHYTLRFSRDTKVSTGT